MPFWHLTGRMAHSAAPRAPVIANFLQRFFCFPFRFATQDIENDHRRNAGYNFNLDVGKVMLKWWVFDIFLVYSAVLVTRCKLLALWYSLRYSSLPRQKTVTVQLLSKQLLSFSVALQYWDRGDIISSLPWAMMSTISAPAKKSAHNS